MDRVQLCLSALDKGVDLDTALAPLRTHDEWARVLFSHHKDHHHHVILIMWWDNFGIENTHLLSNNKSFDYDDLLDKMNKVCRQSKHKILCFPIGVKVVDTIQVRKKINADFIIYDTDRCYAVFTEVTPTTVAIMMRYAV